MMGIDEIRARHEAGDPTESIQSIEKDRAELLRMVEEQVRINDALLEADEKGCELCEKKDRAELLRMVEEGEEEVKEFNAGYAAYERGDPIDSEPPEFRHDQFACGWTWARRKRPLPWAWKSRSSK